MENIIQRTSISQQVMDHILNLVDSGKPVSYTHLTLPTIGG